MYSGGKYSTGQVSYAAFREGLLKISKGVTKKAT